jgi:hypothetical protein
MIYKKSTVNAFFMKEEIHIGNIISQRLKELGIKKKWLAGQVHCTQSNFCKILKKPSMDTDLLLRISLVLQIDFFSPLSNCYFGNQQDNMSMNN